MTKIRVANEWDYGITSNSFPFIADEKSQKIRKTPFVSRYYFVATLIRNAHMCLYKGVTASYFDCSALSLEDYFRFNL
jgi:hypothetical protein